MKTNLLIPENTLFLLALFSAIFTVFTITIDVTSFGIPLEFGRFITYIALLCGFLVAVVLIVDVFRNDISAKYLWTLGFLISGGITGLFYLRSLNILRSRKHKFLRSIIKGKNSVGIIYL